MTGKTHATFGMASSILILGGMYGSPVDLATGLIISGVAAVMPDIDLGGKNSGKIMTRTFIVLPLLSLFMAGIDGIFNQQLISIRPQNFVLGMVMMFILFFFGIKSPHRGFTHSILAAVLFSFSAYLIFGNYASWFAISYTSHILIDLFNKKKIQLLFPTHLGDVCLKMCSADGAANKIIGLLGTIIILFCFTTSTVGKL